MITKKFYLTLVPTNECSLGCEYCYTIHNINDKTKLRLGDITKIIEIISQERSNIEILFIGGEPTSVGYEYFSEILRTLIKLKIKNNLQLSFVMQTNGVLLTESWIQLFKKYNFKVGISFDDFNSNVEHHRPKLNKVEKNLKLLQRYNVEFSIISVFNNETINKLLDNYIIMNKLKYNYKILPLNNNGYIEDRYILKFNEDNYHKMKIFVNQWIYDMSCMIQMRTFHSICYTLLAEKVPLCDSCIENRVSIRPNGMLFPCGRPFDEEYKVGHINEIQNFNQFQDNNGYKKLISLKIAKMNNCVVCKYFNVCHGGCVSNNILDNSYTEMNGFYCNYTTMLLDVFTPLVEILKDDIKSGNVDRYNPILIQDLKLKGLI